VSIWTVKQVHTTTDVKLLARGKSVRNRIYFTDTKVNSTSTFPNQQTHEYCDGSHRPSAQGSFQSLIRKVSTLKSLKIFSGSSAGAPSAGRNESAASGIPAICEISTPRHGPPDASDAANTATGKVMLSTEFRVRIFSDFRLLDYLGCI
jgi:hypothetical protein